MDYTGSPGHVAWLWDRYVEVSKRYLVVKDATDVAEAACNEARRACQAAYDACESAYAEEFQWAQVVETAAREFEAASDAAFLTECGIRAS
jgi:hypothetical protein